MQKAGCLSLPSIVTHSQSSAKAASRLPSIPHGCLLFFPRPVWESHREQIAAWPMSARAWQRIFLGNACDVEMDSAGRILISPELRAAVGLSKDVMLLGMGTHFEIWDAAKLADNEQEAVAGGMPDVLSNFSF